MDNFPTRPKSYQETGEDFQTLSLPDRAESGLLESLATASQINRSFPFVHPQNLGDYKPEDPVDVEDSMVHVWKTLTTRAVSASRANMAEFTPCQVNAQGPPHAGPWNPRKVLHNVSARYG